MRCLVIGAGAIGNAVALALSREVAGAQILHLRYGVRGAASPAAAGILGAQMEAHGDGPLERLCLASRDRFGDWVRELEDATTVDVHYRRSGVLKIARSEAELASFLRSIAWQTRAGLRVEVLDAQGVAAKLANEAAGSTSAGGVFFPDDGRVNPPSLVHALALAIERRNNVRVLVGERYPDIAEVDGRGVKLADGMFIEADLVVVAAGSWSTRFKGIGVREDAVEPVRGQTVILQHARVLPSVIDSSDVYLSPRDDGRVVAGATVERVGFDVTEDADKADALVASARRLLPELESATVVETRVGLRPCTLDELPIIGFTPTGVLLATAHFRNGILLAPITGELVAAIANGKTPAIPLEPYAPARLGWFATGAAPGVHLGKA